MIRTRLTILNCAVLALVLACVGLAIYFTTRERLFSEIDAGLSDRASYFARSWATGPKSPGFAPPPMPPPISAAEAKMEGIDPGQLSRFQALGDSLLPMVVNLEGKDIFMRERKIWDYDSFRHATRGGVSFGWGAQNGLPLRVISVPLVQEGRVFAVAQLSTPVDGVEDELNQLSRTLGIVLPLAILVMLITGVILTRRALQPVSRIAAAADQISATNWEGRLPFQGTDEFARLSNTFNCMLDRLHAAFQEKDEAFARQLRFTADASHELRTPLAAIRARVGLALGAVATSSEEREHMQAIDRASKLMTSIVKDLLLLAKSDEGRLDLKPESVQLKTLVQDAVGAVDVGKHELEIDIEEGISLTVDPAAVTRVFVNIVENAVQHASESELIRVTAKRNRNGVSIQVQDTGEGIAPDQIPLVFNRFHRVDSSRDRASGGSGLGLAIAKGIIEAHGGTIAISSELGKGTAVTIAGL